MVAAGRRPEHCPRLPVGHAVEDRRRHAEHKIEAGLRFRFGERVPVETKIQNALFAQIEPHITGKRIGRRSCYCCAFCHNGLRAGSFDNRTRHLE